jgi:hypothetical protein
MLDQPALPLRLALTAGANKPAVNGGGPADTLRFAPNTKGRVP